MNANLTYTAENGKYSVPLSDVLWVGNDRWPGSCPTVLASCGETAKLNGAPVNFIVNIEEGLEQVIGALHQKGVNTLTVAGVSFTPTGARSALVTRSALWPELSYRDVATLKEFVRTPMCPQPGVGHRLFQAVKHLVQGS